MLTYQDVVTTKLDTLTTAAGQWDAMAKAFKDVEDLYKSKVQPVATDGGWHGLTAASASAQFKATRAQLQGAQTEAKAIASLLRDAHTQFVTLRKVVTDTVAKAVEDDMSVDSHGKATYDFSKIAQYRNDPDYQDYVAKRRRAEATWTRRIKEAVQAVDDADQGAKLALRKAAGVKTGLEKALPGTAHGFNSTAVGDIEVYEAREAKSYADTVLDGGKLSATERANWERLNRDNADDPMYSQTLLNSLGPEDTLKLENRLLDLAYVDDKAGKKDYLGLQKGLADTLAGATRVPVFKDDQGKTIPYGAKGYQEKFADWKKTGQADFYNNWREGMQKAGVKQYDLDVVGDKISVGIAQGQQARGYQSLVTLMQQGDGYSPQFLADITDDMIEAERKDKDIWDLHGSFEGKEDGWFANDPVDGALSVMSKDPEAATGYLDPAADGDKDRLTYLLRDRGDVWDTTNTTNWRGNLQTVGSDTFDEDVRAGLGLALEAATTGQEAKSPGTELGRHSEAQARIMHDTINLLDYGDAQGKGDDDKGRVGKAVETLSKEDHASLRGPLARAMASYSPDTVDILAGDGPGGRTGKEGALAEGDGSQIQNSRSSVLRMMRGVSEDSENYFLIREGQQMYMSEQLSSENFDSLEGIKNRAAKQGEVYGAVNAVGGDLDLGARDAALSEAGDKRVYGYHLVGGMITGLPVVGDMAQRTVDGVANEWLKAVTAEEGLLARERISSSNDAAEQQMDEYFKDWGTLNHQSKDDIGATQREARQSYMGGRELAYDALRERK